MIAAAIVGFTYMKSTLSLAATEDPLPSTPLKHSRLGERKSVRPIAIVPSS